jgi:Sulfotransferase family
VEHRPVDYAALCAAVYLAFAMKQKKRPLIWGDKNNFHITHLPLLNAIYPQARFLHIIRDGRDVACSYREVMQLASSSPYSPHLPTDINDIALEWSTNVLRVDNDLSGLPDSQQLTIRYEDLVHDAAAVLVDVCHWLGLPFEEKMLAAHEVNLRMKLEPALTLDWKRRTLEPVSPDTVGRYRELLSAGEIASFESLAGDTLKKYGYVSDDVI